VGYARKIKELLDEAGWEFHRQGKGDHEIWKNKKTGEWVPIDTGCTNRHTANGTLKDAGLPKAF
jgi:predicted RNA binding protein YcfA (HicA-like mRNA interferase family)